MRNGRKLDDETTRRTIQRRAIYCLVASLPQVFGWTSAGK